MQRTDGKSRRQGTPETISRAVPQLVTGGAKHNYEPDFILHIRGRDGEMVNLIVEVTGARKQDKEAKVETAKTLWVPTVNNHGGFGRWAYLKILDPWDAKNLIRAFLRTQEHIHA